MRNSNNVVIYCRVSTKEQVDEGNSLATQERICKEYALKNKLNITKVFIEQGESAKTTDRKELQKMLLFVAEKQYQISTVLVYKIDRLSRSNFDYSTLKMIFRKSGIDIKSATEVIENTPQGRFFETLLSASAQFDNEVRAERCSGGMLEAVREGRYVWMAPIGYDNIKVMGRANIAPNNMAPFIKSAFELLAKNIYSVDEVLRIITKDGLRLKTGRPVSKPYFHKLIRNKLYTGLIEKFKETHRGIFKPIIEEGLFYLVQKIINRRKKYTNEYKTDNPDFPLRRFIFNSSGEKITGSWAKGRSKTYPYYRFKSKGPSYNQNDLEENFRLFMNSFCLKPEKLNKLKKITQKRFNQITKEDIKHLGAIKSRIEELNKKETDLIEKSLKGVLSDEILKNQLDLVSTEKIDLEANLKTTEANNIDVREAIGFVEKYLTNPSQVWKESPLQTKLKLQWFQFPSGVTFNGNKFETTKIACIFKTKEAFLPPESSVVDLRRFELLTFRLQSDCSTN